MVMWLCVSCVHCVVIVSYVVMFCVFFFFKQKTAYEMRISDWSSDVCSSDLKTAKERAAVLRRWYELMMAAQEDLAKLMTIEQGKPIAESRGEIVYGASFIEWFAEEGKRIYGDTIPGHHGDKRIVVLKEPVGVVSALTPSNFATAMITLKAGPAQNG